MLAAVIVLIVAALFTLWLVALADVIRATEMDQTGRLILAAVLLFAAPLGVLLWMVVRGGRAGAVGAAALVAVTVFLAIGLVTVATSHVSMQTVHAVQGGSASGASGGQAIP